MTCKVNTFLFTEKVCVNRDKLQVIEIEVLKTHIELFPYLY